MNSFSGQIVTHVMGFNTEVQFSHIEAEESSYLQVDHKRCFMFYKLTSELII